jgi:FkbM family methyltransferase
MVDATSLAPRRGVSRTVCSFLVRAAAQTVGRNRLVRAARFLTNEARLDCPNFASMNGELALQTNFLNAWTCTEPVVAFDVGANVGTWTTAFVQQAHRRRMPVVIHAFEPAPDTFVALGRTLATAGVDHQVVTNRIALSNVPGQSTLHSPGSLAGRASLHELEADEPEAQTYLQVETTTVDEYCERAGVQHIDFLKIDAEGHDYFVIAGATEKCRRREIALIQFEYNHRWINARRYLRDVFDLLLPHGYVLAKVTPLGLEVYRRWDREFESFREANFVAVLADVLSRLRTIPSWLDA